MESQEQFASRLFRPMAGEPSGVSTVDIGRAMATGRRRRRLRRATGLSAVACVTLVALISAPVVTGRRSGPPPIVPDPGASTPAPAPPEVPTVCTPARLPEPPGDRQTVVTGGDPSGRFLVGRGYAGDSVADPRPLVWDGLRVAVVDIPGRDQSLWDMTSGGVGVGASYVDGVPVPWIYRDGRASRLPGVADGGASAINEAGTVVGHRNTADGDVPVVWRSAASAPVDLPLPPGHSGRAQDVDEDGTVVGAVSSGADRELPYVWLPDGTHRQLPLPMVDGVAAVGANTTVIRSGWVTGAATMPGAASVTVGVRWDLRTGEARPIPDVSMVRAVNRHGWVVGAIPRKAGDPSQAQAVVVTDAGVLRLPDPPGYPTGGAQTRARTLDDAGTVVAGTVSGTGTGTGTDFYLHAVVWRCR